MRGQRQWSVISLNRIRFNDPAVPQAVELKVLHKQIISPSCTSQSLASHTCLAHRCAEWISAKTLRLKRVDSAGIVTLSKTAHDPQAFGKMVRYHEYVEMLSDLGMRTIVIAFHCGAIQRAIHAFDQSGDPWMAWRSKSIFDGVLSIEAIEETT